MSLVDRSSPRSANRELVAAFGRVVLVSAIAAAVALAARFAMGPPLF